jgi:hypothetical protein
MPREPILTYGTVVALRMTQEKGRAHHRGIHGGASDEEMQGHLDDYRAKAGESSYTSHKMNTNPDESENTLKFKPGNIFALAAWFISQHGLSLLKEFLYPEVVVAWALSTNRYSLDESILTGKNGGSVLDPHRSHAFFRLMADPNARDNATLVSTVLYGRDGAQQWTDPVLDAAAQAKGLPTPSELALCYDLDKAKALCRKQNVAPQAAAEKPPQRSGRFIVLDFLSLAASADAAKLMRDAGLLAYTRLSASPSTRSPMRVDILPLPGLSCSVHSVWTLSTWTWPLHRQ